MSPLIEIKEGEISVNSITTIIEHDDVVVLYLDSDAKYYQSSVGHDENSAFVYLYSDERTLGATKDKSWTQIIFKDMGMKDYWAWPIVSIGRYSAEIVIYRRK